ncbi:class I SAM-dependent methyltransferase [Virgisporangium aurantiacum]|uniref:Methyltransferase domain-containing protein n=1 Tax=Virgisporangium aurantiacum TaxID=175570 RepID=A0A8J3ZAD6_9ACTN|nr:class I SAM-dependent methyltransferase [Virgisporangium aurantiacum]GIJ60344.1 hypothetical protein Vau01_078600 [Virgisporangium aurantiacum]
MTAQQRWLSAQWRFVRSHLPTAPSRVLEIGCGPDGGFVPALEQHGYTATGIDPVAPAGPGYRQTTFEDHDDATGPVDAVVACTSLHHVGDLDRVLDRVATTLVPGGVVIVVEWACETFDEATARWCFARLPATGEPGWLHDHRDRWQASGCSWPTYFDAWTRDEHLHRGDAIRDALQARFTTRYSARTPYFFPDLYPTTEADEWAAADGGEIRPTGIRYVGTAPSRAEPQ